MTSESSSPPDGPLLRADLLDDFYAECDELLGQCRAELTALDQAARAAQPAPAAVESLYRNVHSLKGISAMVGLRVGEELAHAGEAVLRDLLRADGAFPSSHVDLLANVTQRLEQIVTAHRLKQPMPTTSDLLARLGRFDAPTAGATTMTAAPVPAATPAAAASAAVDTVPPTPAGLRWFATFRPSNDLDARGVNINTVRARLTTLGRIVRATPKVEAGGKMSFEFELEVREDPTELAMWAADGITLRPGERPAPAAENVGAAAPSSLFIAPSHIVRVDLSRLDDLMRIVGEMVIHRSRLDDRIAHNTGDRAALQEVNLALGRSLRELREAITRVRLVPVAEIFSRLPFVVRDLAQELGKPVRLALEGQETEIDKFLVERLKEPLLHLVRNAISHGIEPAADRARTGKPAEATLTLRAATSGQSVLIDIIDDGHGIDVEKVRARAAAAGITLSENPTDSELLTVICRPGFSTRDEADRASGRGVGMAVVQTTVRALGGSLSLTNTPGVSTRFTLRLPLTLSIAETFLVSAGGQTCAVPQGFVEEVLAFTEAQVRTIEQAEVIPYRDGILPIIRLRTFFGAPRSTAAQQPLLVLGSERGLCGLVVDKVIGQREVVVRAMQDPLLQVPAVAGATELGDGRPVLILDAVALSSGAVRPRSRTDAALARGEKLSA